MAEEKGIKIPEFSGKHIDWPSWKRKFEAAIIATRPYIIGQIKCKNDQDEANFKAGIMPQIDRDIKYGVYQAQLAAFITVSVPGQDMEEVESMNITEGTKIYQYLQDKYEVKDEVLAAKVNQQLYTIKLKRGESFEDYFNRIANLALQYQVAKGEGLKDPEM